jgi:hypothetical protein
VPREQVVVASKLWREFWPGQGAGRAARVGRPPVIAPSAMLLVLAPELVTVITSAR